MVLVRATGEFILINPKVVDVIASYVREAEEPMEAGGILIGSYRGAHIEIVDCTEPMKKDRRSRFSFLRIDAGHQSIATSAWIKSQKTETFVGEWHTHPDDYPMPSSIDRKTWVDLLRRSTDDLVFIIGGRKRNWFGASNARNIIEPLESI